MNNQHAEEHKIREKGVIREVIFGAEDGLVTAVSIVAGLTGAYVASEIIILAGVIAAVGGAISMALGTYLGNKSQLEFYNREINVERKEIKETPGKERKEVEEHFKGLGFKGRLLNQVVEKIASNKKALLEFMIKEELGISKDIMYRPQRAALFMGVSFLAVSAIPISPYVFLEPLKAIRLAVPATAVALFLIGAVKTKITGVNWQKSGIEMLVVGTVASTAAYLAGHLTSMLY